MRIQYGISSLHIQRNIFGHITSKNIIGKHSITAAAAYYFYDLYISSSSLSRQAFAAGTIDGKKIMNKMFIDMKKFPGKFALRSIGAIRDMV